MKKNENPNQRFMIISGPYDQKSSTSGGIVGGFITYKDVPKEFWDSQPIKDFFHNPSMVDAALYVLLYRNMKGEMKRRIAIFPTLPEDDKEVSSNIGMLADSLGIKVSLHQDVKKIETMSHSMLRPVTKETKTIPQASSCLYELLYSRGLDVDRPFENLSKVREAILRQSAMKDDRALSLVGSFLQAYLEKRDNYFKFADRFTHHLDKTKLKIPTSFIKPTLKSVLIEFPFNVKFENFSLKHAYLSVVREEAFFTELPDEAKSKEPGVIMALCAARYVDGSWDGSSFLSTAINISSNESIEESLNMTTASLSIALATGTAGGANLNVQDQETFKRFILLCLKSLIYIESAEPNLQPEKGAETSRSNPAKMKKFYRHNNPFDAIVVGYGYHGVKYSVDSTVVSGFFRWQRFGPGFTQVKLIWIDEFVRHYNQDQDGL